MCQNEFDKIDDLRLTIASVLQYKLAHILTITESWGTEKIADDFLEIEGFTMIRHDRRAESGKKKGGGLIIYVRKDWGTNISVKHSVCNTDLEAISLSIRPFYLPREFNDICITATIYCPPSGKAERASEQIEEMVNCLEKLKPNAAHIVLGDFNHVIMEQTLCI